MNWETHDPCGASSASTDRPIGQPVPGVSGVLAVSFDRPNASYGDAGRFFLELPLVSRVLREHLNIACTTDLDRSRYPDAQPLVKVAVLNGHDDY